MKTTGTKVSYAMGSEECEAAFRRDFVHLYYRMRQLRDAIIAYYLDGDIHKFVSAQFEPKGIPFICCVTFDAEKAKKYCERMERYFAKIPSKPSEYLPRPQFAVDVLINFDEGAEEPYSFDFRGYCDEKVIDFCQKIKERGVYYRRRRILKNLNAANYNG